MSHHVPPPVKATRQTDPGRDLSVLPGRDSYPEDDWPSDDIASDRTHLPYNLPSTSSGFFAAKRSDTSDVIQQVEHSFDSLSVPVQQAFPESQQPVSSVLPAAVASAHRVRLGTTVGRHGNDAQDARLSGSAASTAAAHSNKNGLTSSKFIQKYNMHIDQ